MKTLRYLVRMRWLCTSCQNYTNRDLYFSTYFQALRCLSMALQSLDFDSAWLIDVDIDYIIIHIDRKEVYNNETQR